MDDVCTYVGSQNLYVFDLAEWGVVIDDKDTTSSIMETLWTPTWAASYDDGSDCNVDAVMDALDIDRDPHDTATEQELAAMNQREFGCIETIEIPGEGHNLQAYSTVLMRGA